MIGAVINWAERQDGFVEATPEEWAEGLRNFLKHRTFQYR